MSEQEFSIESALDILEAVMPPSKQPKVLLFDIGGVCVTSPMQAILDYELSNSIPPGWINYSISSSAPNGFWHHLERGDILLDTSFFTGFSINLHNPTLWDTFYTTKTLPSNLSLQKDIPPLPKVDAEFLFWSMMRESRAMDPWMYPALLKLKESKKYILAALSNTVIFPPSHPYSTPNEKEDVKRIFDVFISSAHVGLRKPDPRIYELALKEVDTYARTNAAERGVGLGWNEGVKAEDIIFLDDIGQNLRAAKKVGFGTLKVPLGKAFESVDELERITGLELAGGHPRITVTPKIPAKLAAKL